MGTAQIKCIVGRISVIVDSAYNQNTGKARLFSGSTGFSDGFVMMWFRRPEFDRICWLHTDGSVRGGITWDDICRLELPIPPIENQLEIVNSYKAITERIALKQKINDNLAA